jgi:formate dehydrogenase subunit gamma
VTEPLTRSRRQTRDIIRFTTNEIAQHWVLMLTLTVLALTGLGLLMHDTWLGRWLITLEGGVESRGIIHRVFAVVLMALVGWHFFYVVFTDRGHRQVMDMLPRARDARDTRDLLAYYVGARHQPPEFGRYTPMQKLQYWGAGIGSLIMIATGLALWFSTQVMAVAPKWFIDVTTIVHGYEGLILFVLLFGWHLYIVHVSPGNFPLQRTFLDGRIDRARLWLEHRAMYRELYGDEPPTQGEDA